MFFSLAFLMLARAQAAPDDLIQELQHLDATFLPERLPGMLSRDAESRIERANHLESAAWEKVATRADWESFRDARIRALRESLGAPETPPGDLRVRVTRTMKYPGYRIDNLCFESRPGLVVTANVYSPLPEQGSMPGILILHSHHNPKSQGELQDMGVTWARLGCAVLIMDQIGHGERRQHPFGDSTAYPGKFKVGRQDYYFRFVTGLQLNLIGESLLGWMAWDVQRGVDLLLGRPGIDPHRIILLGAVAGGGDPASVAAALDPRVSALVEFNFGGPQPETVYPLPLDVEASFNYAGSGSWESTRNLRLSARDGFLPWVIVAAAAPRNVVYGHEFSWDRLHDPVWKRLERVFDFYHERGNLAGAMGQGTLKGQPPEASHCNNIGPVQRQALYPAFRRWFGIAEPEQESKDRCDASQLACLPPDLKPRLVRELARERAQAVRPRPEEWNRLLGDAAPAGAPAVLTRESKREGSLFVDRVTLEVDRGILVPLLFLKSPAGGSGPGPLVIAVAQGGKQEFLKHRAGEIAALLKGGAAVCLPDLRGTGETSPGGGRGRGSQSTSIASTELMLGRTLVGLRVRDLRSVLGYLRQGQGIDPGRIALWGDSWAPSNPPDRRLDVPLDAEDPPALAEPMGGLVALLCGFLEEGVRAVAIRGGLSGYRSMLETPFCYVPYDAMVPGALTAGDLPDIAKALAPRSFRMEEMVDGLNRRIPLAEVGKMYGLEVVPSDPPLAGWLLKSLEPR